MGEGEDGPQECGTDTPAARRLLGREPRESQDGQRITRETLPVGLWNIVACDLGRCDGREAEDGPIVDGDVGCSDMMPELILSGVTLEKAVELDIPGTEE